MQAENITRFSPLRDAWHQLLVIRKAEIIKILPTDPLVKKGVAYLANGLKKRVVEVALIIATLFALFYSLMTYPYRCYLSRKHAEEVAIPRDIARMTPPEIEECEGMINKYFIKHKDRKELSSSISTKDQQKFIQKCVAQCARSQKVYGPVVRAFVDNLLQKAHNEGKKLVFMARDGICYYEVAKKLMEKPEYKAKFPNLAKKDSLILGYFTRKIVSEFAVSSDKNKELFRKYVFDELKIQPGEPYVFVDIGFKGSMVDPIRKLLPEVDIQFNFLMSTSDKVEGYLANVGNPLSHLGVAAQNLAIKWVEETHHGSIESPNKLVNGSQGTVQPDTLYPTKKRLDAKYSESYLVRKFCLKGLIDHAVKINSLTVDELERAREIFNNTLGDLKTGQLNMAVGWDDYFWDLPV